MSDDFLSFLPYEDVKADLPSFTPPPQATPESFDEELDNLDVDVQSLTLDDIFLTPSGLVPSPGLALPSDSAYTADSSMGPATASEYSSMAYSTSNYSAPFDFGSSPGFASAPNSIYTTESNEYPATSEYSSATNYTSDYPAHFDFTSQLNAIDPKRTIFSDPSVFLDSSGLQLSPALFPDVCVAEAQSDDGFNGPPVGISPHVLSAAFQGPTSPYQTDPPVGAASAKKSRTGPIKEEYTCPECGRVLTSGRKSNLKSHIDTHNPHRKRPFVCPHSDCSHRFVRSNDLKRHIPTHMRSQHGD
ncbi:hypothetical protein EDB85DRAFT_1971448 [Lactarius pseudohatsudake]|nr:hypothetical protein EDB85DRAFT_1971448 [Lactarius pseudohatsudake]